MIGDIVMVPCPKCGKLAELRGVPAERPYLATAGPMDSPGAIMQRVLWDGAICDDCGIRFAPVAIHT